MNNINGNSGKVINSKRENEFIRTIFSRYEKNDFNISESEIHSVYTAFFGDDDKKYAKMIQQLANTGIYDIERVQIPTVNPELPSTSIALFMREANRYPKMSKEEEIRFVKLMRSPQTEPKQREKMHKLLIASQCRYVMNIALSFIDRLDLGELISVGNLAICENIDKYDPDRNTKIITFLSPWIRCYMSDACYENSKGLKVPTNTRKQIAKLKNLENKHQKNGENVSFRDLLIEAKIPRKSWYLVGIYSKDVTSLNITIENNKDGTHTELSDFIASDIPTPEQEVLRTAQNEHMDKILNEMIPKTRDRQIVKMRIGLDNNRNIIPVNGKVKFKDIAKYFNISPERVRQIYRYNINLLRDNDEFLKELTI